MKPDGQIGKHIREEVHKAHRTALNYRTDYKRFDYRFKMRNEICRIVDCINDTDFYKMGELKEEFRQIVAKAKNNGWSQAEFLDELCGLILAYAQEYREEQMS